MYGDNLEVFASFAVVSVLENQKIFDTLKITENYFYFLNYLFYHLWSLGFDLTSDNFLIIFFSRGNRRMLNRTASDRRNRIFNIFIDVRIRINFCL